MPWRSDNYEQPIRLRDILGIKGLLLFLLAYEFMPAPHARNVTPSSQVRDSTRR